MIRFKIIVLVAILVTWTGYGIHAVEQTHILAERHSSELYDQKCASCHGSNGLKAFAPIDGSDCNLTSVQNMVECYPKIDMHRLVSDCDDNCKWSTNDYIYDELLYTIGQNQYLEFCAGCHGDNGMQGAVIDGSHCPDLNSIEAIVKCYAGIGAHGSLFSKCNETCQWHTSRYIYETLLETLSTNDTVIKAEEVNNDNWTSCFIMNV
ncbi:MAG: cytochrome c [Desulfobacteraceae bacterium]|nr:cytochrome c [Desulfobacteraceae bacterium]